MAFILDFGPSNHRSSITQTWSCGSQELLQKCWGSSEPNLIQTLLCKTANQNEICPYPRLCQLLCAARSRSRSSSTGCRGSRPHATPDQFDLQRLQLRNPAGSRYVQTYIPTIQKATPNQSPAGAGSSRSECKSSLTTPGSTLRVSADNLWYRGHVSYHYSCLLFLDAPAFAMEVPQKNLDMALQPLQPRCRSWLRPKYLVFNGSYGWSGYIWILMTSHGNFWGPRLWAIPQDVRFQGTVNGIVPKDDTARCLILVILTSSASSKGTVRYSKSLKKTIFQ